MTRCSTSNTTSVLWLAAKVGYCDGTGSTGYVHSDMLTMNGPATEPVFLTSTTAVEVLKSVAGDPHCAPSESQSSVVESAGRRRDLTHYASLLALKCLKQPVLEAVGRHVY